MHYPQIIETIGAFIGRRHELVAAVNAHTPKNAIALRRMLARSAILRRPAGSQSRLAGSSSMGVACQSALGNKILLATFEYPRPSPAVHNGPIADSQRSSDPLLFTR